MIKTTPEIRKRLSNKKAAYWEARKKRRQKFGSIPMMCINCNDPFKYRKMIKGRLFEITGTAKIAGVYKKKGKIVGKVYGHFPDCSAQKLKLVVVRL